MKIHVKRRFNSAGETYDSSANIQKIVAKKLASLIETENAERVAELGVGSGIFTSELGEKVSFESLTGIDIAFSLLKKAKEVSGDNINFVEADGERLPLKNGCFDLLGASSVLQWFEHVEESLPNALKLLKKKGEFCFSIFVEGTFQEMKLLHSMTGFGHVYPLRPYEDYLKILENEGVQFSYEVIDHLLYYDSVKQFLSKQKNTGARYTGSRKPVGKNAYKRFCELYKEMFSDNGKIPVTYTILYVRGKV